MLLLSTYNAYGKQLYFNKGKTDENETRQQNFLLIEISANIEGCVEKNWQMNSIFFQDLSLKCRTFATAVSHFKEIGYKEHRLQIRY